MAYVPGTLEPARREVELAYLREGYNDVRVSVTSVADADLPAAHIEVEVTEGPQQVLEEVTIAGADTTSAGTVRRALDLDVGEPAELGDTYRAQKRLYDTGVFRRADVELEPIGDAVQAGTQPVRAAVTLEETPLYRFRYGVRLTDDTGPVEANREFRPGLVADLLRRNLFGRALSTGVAGQVESNRRLVRGVLTAPQFFTLPVTSSLFLTQARQNIETPGSTPFVQDISEATAEQRFNPRSNMAVSYSYRFLRTRAFELDPPDTDTPFDLRVHVARLTSTFAWDTRDDPFNARNGWVQSSGFEWAVPSLGSDLRFLKLILQQFYFKSVGRDVVLASALRLGTAWGFEGPLLFSERYFVGGGTSLRGFAENGVGSVDFLNEPVGGASSLILNQELRFPLYKWVRGVGFVDAGNVFQRAGDLSFKDLEYGAGLGLRIDTPFGLARIDYGMPLTSRSREPFGRWYFSLGQAF
jgi:outer membrane protein insertion porin family